MIIKVVSIKGGVGKSVISAYMAKYLAENNSNNVLLIDNDNISFSSALLKLNKINNVEVIRNENSIDNFKKFNYIVIDCPTLVRHELFSTCSLEHLPSDSITILVSDVTSIGYVSELRKTIEGIKILIVNMVSPFPDDIDDVSAKVKELDFDVKVIIPFIPKVFLATLRDINDVEIEVLKKLSLAIQSKDFNRQLLSPFL